MSLFFGIFAKSRDLLGTDWRPCVDELGHEGRRTVEVHVWPRLVLATVDSVRELDAPRIAENGQAGTQLLLGGEIFDYEGALPDLERRGHPIDDPRHQAAVVLHGFEEHGTAFLSRLTGAFALAHHDPRSRTLTLANDPFGMHPLLIWDSEDYCLFGSEVEPLTRFHGFEPVLDEQSVSEYFALQQPYDGRTFFAGITNLAPGTVLRTGASRDTRRYEDLAIAVDRSQSFEDAVDATFECLRRAAAARLRYRDSGLAALTGGLDSRLLIGLLTDEERDRVEFRTIHETWMTEEEDADLTIACALAERYDLKLVVRDSEGPGRTGVVDRSFLERLRTLKGKGFKFEGFYGDNFMTARWEHPVIDGFLREWSSDEVRSRLEEILDPELLSRLPDPLETVRAFHGQIAAEQQDFLYYIQRMTRAWFTNLGGGSPKGWVMPQRHVTHGLDSIFRDTALLRHLLTVPTEMLRDRRLYERLYERCLPKLCEIPTTRSSSVVPRAPLARSRRAAPPADYRPILDEYLGSSATWAKGLYDEARLRASLADLEHWAVPSFADLESWYRERFLPVVG